MWGDVGRDAEAVDPPADVAAIETNRVFSSPRLPTTTRTSTPWTNMPPMPMQLRRKPTWQAEEEATRA